MNIEEKRTALYEFCEGRECADCLLDGKTTSCCFDELRDEHVEHLFSIAFPDEKSGIQEAMEKVQECGIKDSGNRTEFASGAVRDIQEGKGRCDLLPLDVIGFIYAEKSPHPNRKGVFANIDAFIHTGQTFHLADALEHFMLDGVPFGDCNWATIYLEVAKHFEEGAKKYGERNWEKGIPTERYIDSAIRHYLKWLRGDKDEPHDRAFCWNILCCIWTCIHKPELNSYAKDPGASASQQAVPQNENRCVVCLETIPEGQQLCPKCQDKGWKALK